MWRLHGGPRKFGNALRSTNGGALPRLRFNDRGRKRTSSRFGGRKGGRNRFSSKAIEIAELTDAEERRLRPAVWLREIVAAF